MKKFIRFLKIFGIRETFVQFYDRVRDKYFLPSRIMYYIPLNEINLKLSILNKDINIHRYNSFEQIPEQVLKEIINTGTIDSRQSKNRNIWLEFLESNFKLGGNFWIARLQGSIVGYQWTLLGGGSHSFYLIPIVPEDLILFAIEVFPPFRGQGINITMTTLILEVMKSKGFIRAYIDIETRRKRNPSHRSFKKMNFKKLGIVKSRQLFGRYFTIWDKHFYSRNYE